MHDGARDRAQIWALRTALDRAATILREVSGVADLTLSVQVGDPRLLEALKGPDEVDFEGGQHIRARHASLPAHPRAGCPVEYYLLHITEALPFVAEIEGLPPVRAVLPGGDEVQALTLVMDKGRLVVLAPETLH